jgi:hypothetical protein
MDGESESEESSSEEEEVKTSVQMKYGLRSSNEKKTKRRRN